MSHQAELIAKKKAEIEAKLKGLQSGEDEASGSGNPGPSASKSSLKSPSFGSGSKKGSMNLKNRWGFKGKSSSSKSASISSAPDSGSFSGSSGSFSGSMTSGKGSSLNSESGSQGDWYQSALQRARNIAKTLGAPSTTSGSQDEVKIKKEEGSGSSQPSRGKG